MRWKKPSLLDHESLFPIMEKRIPFNPHSQNSRKAARDVAPKEGSQLYLALAHVRSQGAHGCCDFEAISNLVREWPTVANGWRARRTKLAKAGLIVLAPFTRCSPSGSACDVWIAKEFST